MIKLHLFDMDGTLIDNDCDVSWKQFVVDIGIAPASDIELADKFYQDYVAGQLNFDEFMLFQFREFIGKTREEMAELCQRHFETMVKKTCRPGALELVKQAKAAGIPTAILSSTNTIISEPVRAFFGIDRTFGTVLEVDEKGLFTGKIQGECALGPNKVTAMRRIAEEMGVTPAEIAAYGDSCNDIPLLSAVGEAFIVSPAESLLAEAKKQNWQQLYW